MSNKTSALIIMLWFISIGPIACQPSEYNHRIGIKYFNYFSSNYVPYAPYDILSYQYELALKNDLFRFAPEFGFGLLDLDVDKKLYYEIGFSTLTGKRWFYIGLNADVYYDSHHKEFGGYTVLGPRFLLKNRLFIEPSIGWSLSKGYFQSEKAFYPAFSLKASYCFSFLNGDKK